MIENGQKRLKEVRKLCLIPRYYVWNLEKASALGSDNPSLPLLSQNARIRCLAITVLEEIHYILCLPLHDKMEKMLHNIQSQLTDMAILTNYYYV